MRPVYIPRYPKCLENYMNNLMSLLSNIEQLNKFGVKTMEKSWGNDMVTCFEIYLMFIICYPTLPL